MDRPLAIGARVPYSPAWLTAERGANLLCCGVPPRMALEPGMRCSTWGGRAASSVFQAGARRPGVGHRPLAAPPRTWRRDAAGRRLPGAARAPAVRGRLLRRDRLDDSFVYYGTDDLSSRSRAARGRRERGLPELRPGPEHLGGGGGRLGLHSARWWRGTGSGGMSRPDTMEDGWERWLDWQRAAPGPDRDRGGRADRGARSATCASAPAPSAAGRRLTSIATNAAAHSPDPRDE